MSMDLQPPSAPHKPGVLKAKIEIDRDRLALRFRNRTWFPAAFLSLWLTGWTVGCAFLIGLVASKPEPFTILFAVPFWAAWLFTAAMLVRMLTQVEELTLDSQGVDYRSRSFISASVTRVPLREMKEFTRYSQVVDSDSGRREQGIEITTRGRAVRCLGGLPEDEIAWLMNELNSHLGSLQATSRDTKPAESVAESAEAPSPSLKASEGKLTLPAGGVSEPPFDCLWVRTDDFDVIRFEKRGKFSVSTLLGALFVNCFWNGIVSVFVLQLWGKGPGGLAPDGWEWWGLFVFLIPFEAIGLVMVLFLVGTFFEPAHRTTWLFARDFIERRHTWFGVGPRKSWLIESLDRIEMKQKSPGTSDSSATTGKGAYRLLFIDRNNQERCGIADLTEGEACYIGQTVLAERGEWFR